MSRPMFVDILRRFRMRYCSNHLVTHAGDLKHADLVVKAGTFWENSSLMAYTPYSQLLKLYVDHALVLSLTGIRLTLPGVRLLYEKAVHLKNCLAYKDYSDASVGMVWQISLPTREARMTLWELPLDIELYFSTNYSSESSFSLSRRQLLTVPSPWALFSIAAAASGVVMKLAGQIAEALDEFDRYEQTRNNDDGDDPEQQSINS